MATIVNTPAAAHEDTGSSMSLIIGVLIVLSLIALFFFVGLPAIRSVAAPAVQAPPQISVPDKINVDVNNPGAPAK